MQVDKKKDDGFANDYSIETANQYFRSIAKYCKDGT